MKPINLKIKGLNSFIDSQEINFEKLTDKGLFGIFGPTGSGKSTILDGITLALYGEVARKSTNFMNTNCEYLIVSFEFQMAENQVKRYRVDREFKRDNKTGNVRSKSAKVIDITQGNELILEEGAKTVTEKCEEIIGLKLEDFTRTVVLPQGKFSEFLKLEGKDRRNMLERLFNLQKYGDDLSFKLGSKIKKEREKSNILEGELKSFQDISGEILANKTKALSEIKNQCENCQVELINAEKNFSDGKILCELQREMKENLDLENQLKQRETVINESEIKVTLGESVLKVKPYIDGYENTLQQIKITSDELKALIEIEEIIKKDKEKTEAVLEIVKEKKENEVPQLKIKEQRVIDTIKEDLALSVLLKEKKLLIEDIGKLEEKLKSTNNKIKKNDINIKSISDNIGDKDCKAESLKIHEEYKKKVNEGIVVLNIYESLMEQKNELSMDIKTTLLNIEDTQKKSEVLSKQLKDKESQLYSDEEALKKLIEICPGDQNTLLSLQQKLSNVKEKWDKYNEYTAVLNKSNKSIETLIIKLNIGEQEKLSFEDEIIKISGNIKKIETENLAHTLRESLSEGEICPVCGAREHRKENILIVDFNDVEQLKTDLKTIENKLNKLTTEINKAQANIETELVNIKEKKSKLNELGEDFKADSPDTLQKELNKLKTDINNYSNQKTNLENKIKISIEDKSKLLVEYNKANSNLVYNRDYCKKLQEDSRIKDEKFKKTDNELSALKAELAIEDFRSKSDEIFEKEKQKSALEKEIKIQRENLKKVQELNETLINEFAALNEDFKIKNTIVFEKDKNIQEKENSIKSKVGDVDDLESFKKEISRTIKKIEEEYAVVEKHKKEMENQYNECNNKKISSQGNLNSLNQRSIKDKETLENAFIEEGIKDINEAKQNFIAKEEIDKLKFQIEKYKTELIKLAGTIDSLKNKIINRSLSEEQWIDIQNTKNEKAEKLKFLVEDSINLETEVKLINEKLIKKNKLLITKKELEHKFSLLDDLEKLFKGKKFVEFVATNQLNYVCIEACRKLKEITSGNYGLEVDENGKFLIRDYKNGGAQRDASTLSGGETFVASLALALSLSAQIQLKGTSPLELFFLDEGFGTLDDNLMEVVMDSLEKIHNDKLSIGIISHVEAIKNRVPVKLIVTAAEAGMGGSKVKIERS